MFLFKKPEDAQRPIFLLKYGYIAVRKLYHIINDRRCERTELREFANREDSDQPVHPCSLISLLFSHIHSVDSDKSDLIFSIKHSAIKHSASGIRSFLTRFRSPGSSVG